MGDETGSWDDGGCGEVASAWGSAINKTPLPPPTSNDLLSFWPPKYYLLSLGNVWKELLFSMVCTLLSVPALPNPGSARAARGRAFPGHSDARQRAQTWCKHPISHPRLL